MNPEQSNVAGMTRNELLRAAAQQLNAEGRAIDAQRKRPAMNDSQREAFNTLTTGNKFAAAFGKGDPAQLVQDQPDGPVATVEAATARFDDPIGVMFADAFSNPRTAAVPAAPSAVEPDHPQGGDGLEAPPVAAPDDRKRLPEAIAPLFDRLDAELGGAVAAPPTLPADAVMRRLFRELPGAARVKVAAAIEEADFGMSNYFTAAGLSTDHVATLVADALARRLSDAQRLEPEMTAEQLLSRMAEG